MPKNYTVYHLHSTTSNLSGAGMDSVTSYKDYVKAAKECGMTSLCFSEHGNFFLYKKKKDEIEKNGMKYIHGIEAYVTEDISNQVRDNYHMVLIAKNYDGFKELNRLQSQAFQRDGHYYYAPRIPLDDILNTSENIIVTSACIGGPVAKGNDSVKEKVIHFFAEHKDRCFLEIQHHNVEKQKEYNKYLLELHNKYGIPLIAGTDTHCLNKEHEKARKIMQLSKRIVFNDDEAGWDLVFKTYDELVDAYRVQNCLPESVYLEAIENTNVMAEMVEPITFDTSFKYPKLYDNSKEKLYDMMFDKTNIANLVSEGFSEEEIIDRLQEEFDTFVAVDAVDYILLIKYIIDWAHGNDMWQGPARGSAASSLALYELGITEVNPLKYGFKFWRFMHRDKYSSADVDTDWAEKDRDRLKEWMLVDRLNLPRIQTAEIITFNSIALKGAIRDVGRGLNIPLQEVDTIAKAVKEVSEEENKITVIDDEWRQKYPELFKYVDIVQGVFTSIGIHPSGVLVTDEDISEEIGYCYIKGNDYPVSVLDMKELDSRNFVKEDLLGLDNVSTINETCKLAGIPRISPKTIDYEDDETWEAIKKDTALLFQINSNYGKRTVDKLFSKEVWDRIKKDNPTITRLDLLAFACALVRPCGKSIYPLATEGISNKTGVDDIDALLAPEMGYPLLQETQMEFVQNFCGYSFLESDKLRKCVAEGSLITMADGSLKPIEDVQVGENVISYKDGAFIPKKVIGHYNNGIRPIIKIVFENGCFLGCTQDHKLLSTNGWRDAGRLSENSYMVTNITSKHTIAVKYIGEASLCNVWDLEIEDTHNYLANGIVCHNCIAKKIGTRDQIPKIKEGFENNAKIKYSLSQEKSDEIIDMFCQCVLDATRYSFNRSHDYSYTIIAYESAYLRTHYPLEYLTCCFNTYIDKPDKINEVTEYCINNNIKIFNPKFRYSKAEYFFNKENNSIYKGTKSIKFMNTDVSDKLYALRENKYNSFVDLLYDIWETGIDTRQLDILVKLDYFSEFGNSKELLRIISLCATFKNGKAKSFSKEKLANDEVLYRMVARNSNETAKKFSILNCKNILDEAEFYIKSIGIQDFMFKDKALFQEEYMGCIDIKTQKKEDRPNIMILDMIEMKKIGESRPWGISVTGQSIGSGIRNNYTIRYQDFCKEKFDKYDIIKISKFHKTPKGYWVIDGYRRLVGI